MKKSKRNERRRIFIILLLLLPLIAIVILLNNKNGEICYSFEIEKSNLLEAVSDYVEKNNSIEVLKQNDNKIYGSIIDYENESMLLETSGLFQYDIETEEVKFYSINEDVRIMDFVFLDDKAYYVKIYLNDDIFTWKIVEADLTSQKEEILDEGNINNAFNYPRLIFINNHSFISVTQSNDDSLENEEYKITYYENKTSEILIKDNGSLTTDNGILLYNIANIHVYNNIIYYTVVDQNHVQRLKSYNISTKEEQEIYVNEDSNNYILYNFKKIEDGLYIQLVDKTDEQKAKLIFIYDITSEYVEIESELNTFDNYIGDGNILFHNDGDKWSVFSSKDGKLYSVSNVGIELYPLYLIIDSNKIFIEDFDGNFYTASISKKCN